MKLAARYLGFDLDCPIVPGASPLADTLDSAKRLEDAGAPMIVVHSLFEEQLASQQMNVTWAMEHGDHSYGEALSYLPDTADFRLGPDDYLNHIANLKQSLVIPVVGSINGRELGSWLEFARLIVQAGADALELNIYEPAMDADFSSLDLESRLLEIVREVCKQARVPVAVKLSPFYAGFAHLARDICAAGAAALVIFNRFYQPDIDLAAMEVRRRVRLSTSEELPLRLRWAAALHGRINAQIAITGGVHSGTDVVKCILAGADVAQVVSCLLAQGPAYFARLRAELATWVDENQYENIAQMRGSMSLRNCPNPSAYERANYMQILASWTH
mgnify:CR=1 FL=1